MGEMTGKILGVVAVLAIFIVVIMGTIYPAIKDTGKEVDEQIRNTNVGMIHQYHETELM